MGRRGERGGVRTVATTPVNTDWRCGLDIGRGGAYSRRMDTRGLNALITRSKKKYYELYARRKYTLYHKFENIFNKSNKLYAVV